LIIKELNHLIFKLVRSGLLIIVLVFLVIPIFYFWAGSPNLPKQQYRQIKKYHESSSIPDQDTLSIISFNIGYLSGMTNNLAVRSGYDFFHQNMEHAVEIFQDRSPTFIGFQEIDYHAKRSWYVNQMDSIAKKLKFPYGAYVVNWDKRYVPFPYWPVKVHFGKLISGQALLSQYPILNNRRIVFPKPDKNPFYYNAFYLDRLLQFTEMDVKGNRLLILNVHLEAFDTETREIQARILKDTVERYSKRYPLLLIGDFNCRPPFMNIQNNEEITLRVLQSIPGMHMTIREREYQENPAEYYTYSSRHPTETIDYIIHNERIQAISFEVIGESYEISDHRPVYFKFIIKKN